MSKDNLWGASTRLAQHKRCDVHSSLKADLAQTANKRGVQASDMSRHVCISVGYYSKPVAEKTFDYILGLFSFHTILQDRNFEITQDFWNMSQNHIYVNVWCKIKLLIHNSQSLTIRCSSVLCLCSIDSASSMFWQGSLHRIDPLILHE